LTILAALFKLGLRGTPLRWQFLHRQWCETGMAGLLNGRWRTRVGAILVAVYALCLVMPVAALAAGSGIMSEHCLGGEPHSIAMMDHAMVNHMAMGEGHHHDGMSHQPSSGHDDHGLLCKCCAQLCISALAPDMGVFTFQPVGFTHLTSLPSESLSGLGFGRIDRPPRSLLSL
jgi:hypothetical protein